MRRQEFEGLAVELRDQVIGLMTEDHRAAMRAFASRGR
jgi:hypothetical protein